MKQPGKSLIDAGVVVTGTVSCTGELEVMGQVQGDLHCATLAVSQPGHIRGDVYAENASIDGRVDGTIRAAQVMLRSGAHVTGDIHHTSLVIEHGAIFEGKVRRSKNPAQVQPAAAPQPAAPQPAPQHAAPSQLAQPPAQPPHPDQVQRGPGESADGETPEAWPRQHFANQ